MAKAPSTFETEIQTDDATTADIGIGQKVDPKARSTNTDASSVEVNLDRSKKPIDPKEVLEDLEKEGLVGDEPGEVSEDDAEKVIEAELEDLGEWKPGDPALQEKFDSRYFTEGKLNSEALTKEFWANATEDKPGALKEATYEYLRDTLGVTKAFCQEVERGLVAEGKARNEQFYSTVGGKERFEAAVAWGKSGGYTPAQRARFNKLQAAGGEDFTDAVEALMARFTKANPESAPAPTPRRGPPKAGDAGERRRSSPERSVTSGPGGGANGGDTFPDYASYQTAWSAALRVQKEATTPEAKREAKDKIEGLRKKARRSRFA